MRRICVLALLCVTCSLAVLWPAPFVGPIAPRPHQSLQTILQHAFPMLWQNASAGMLMGVQGGSGATGFTPAYISSGTCVTGSNTCTITLSVAAGNFAVCGVLSTSVPTNTLTCTDANTDSFSYPSSSPYLSTGLAIMRPGFALMSATASEVFTCHVTNGANYFTCSVLVFSGTPTSGWDVALAGATGSPLACPCTNTPVNSGTTAATSVANELSIGLMGTGAAPSDFAFTGTGGYSFPAAGQIRYSTAMYIALGYKALTSIGTQQATSGANTSYTISPTPFGAVSTIK